MSGFAFQTEIFRLRHPSFPAFFACAKNASARKHTQGTAPRSEPRVATADRDEIKIRGSMRFRPPRPPKERASRERQPTEILCTAEKVSVFGAKPVCSASRAARPRRAGYLNFSPSQRYTANKIVPSTLLCFFLSKKEDVLLLLYLLSPIALSRQSSSQSFTGVHTALYCVSTDLRTPGRTPFFLIAARQRSSAPSGKLTKTRNGSEMLPSGFFIAGSPAADAATGIPYSSSGTARQTAPSFFATAASPDGTSFIP